MMTMCFRVLKAAFACSGLTVALCGIHSISGGKDGGVKLFVDSFPAVYIIEDEGVVLLVNLIDYAVLSYSVLPETFKFPR